MSNLLELADDLKFLFTGIVYEPLDLAALTRTNMVDARFSVVGGIYHGVVIRRYESDCKLGMLLREGHWQHEEMYGRAVDCSREEIICGQWETHARLSSALKDRGCTVRHHADERTRQILDIYGLRFGLL